MPSKLVNRNRQRAELMVEYYASMRTERRRELEEESQWVHQLVPEAMRGRIGDDDNWNGSLYAIRPVVASQT